MSRCDTCQYLGEAVFPSVQRCAEGIIIGFSDRPNGEPVSRPARKCLQRKNVLVYDDTEWECQYWEERTWKRPETCGECQLRSQAVGGKVRCMGHPFCGLHDLNEPACINGQMEDGYQMTIFDYEEG